jgi:hypothetical protein
MVTPVSPAELASPEAFAKRVRLGRTTTAWAKTLLTLGIIGLVFKIINTLSILSDNPRANIFRAYFYTIGTDATETAWKTFFTWGPIVAIIAAGIFLLYSAATNSSATRDAFDEFHSRGYVAQQGFTGLSFTVNNRPQSIVVLSHPALPAGVFEQNVTSLQQYVRGLDSRTASRLAADINRAGASRGVAITDFFPSAPRELVLTASKPGPAVVVIPPDPLRTGSRGRILPLKS